MKFKVGDTVKVVKSNRINKVDEGYVGEIVAVKCGLYDYAVDFGEKIPCNLFVCTLDGRLPKASGRYYYEHNLELVKKANDNRKIVITTDGKETLARLYEGNKVIKSATAKCSPEDTFDFKTGAKLAFDRLVGEEPKREYKVGQKYRVNDNDWHGVLEVTKIRCNGFLECKVIEGLKGYKELIIDSSKEFARCFDIVEEPEIKVGDTVIVVDNGQSYSRYVKWFEKNAPALVGYFSYSHSPEIGTRGVVKSIAPHSEDNSEQLYAIRTCKQTIYLLNEKGIKKVEG